MNKNTSKINYITSNQSEYYNQQDLLSDKNDTTFASERCNFETEELEEQLD